MKIAESEGIEMKYAVATHEHFDHSRTLHELAERLGEFLNVL